MTWFKVDDKCWSHPKFLRLSSVSFGVWARVGAYCSDHLTDGYIDSADVHAICPDSRAVVNRAIAELVEAGLWEPLGDTRHRYHDWNEHQPSRDEVEASRAASRERQRRAREKRAKERAEAAGEDVPTPSVTPIAARDRRRW